MGRAKSRPFSPHRVLFSILQIKQHAPKSTSVPQGAGRHKGDGWKTKSEQDSWQSQGLASRHDLTACSLQVTAISQSEALTPHQHNSWFHQDVWLFLGRKIYSVDLSVTNRDRLEINSHRWFYLSSLMAEQLLVSKLMPFRSNKLEKAAVQMSPNLVRDVKEGKASLHYSHWTQGGRDLVLIYLKEADEAISARDGPEQKEKGWPA